MGVKIRLQRRGAHKRPFYHIVVADYRAPRDGKFLEKIGTYNPLTEPKKITLLLDRYENWVKQGAQPTDAVASLLRQFRKNQPADNPV